MNRKILPILACYLSFACAAFCTDSLSIPKLYPSTFISYDVDQGLLTSCVVETFTDPKGRLWVNPCRKLDMHKGESFFQYDGNKSYTFSLPDLGEGPESSSWFIMGITDEGILYGTNINYSHAFLFNPELQETFLFPFKKEEKVKSLLKQEDNTIIAITLSPSGYSVYRLTKDQKESLGSIDESFSAGFSNLPLKITQSGSNIYWLHEDEGFINYHLDTKTFKNFSWNDLLNTNAEFGSPNKVILTNKLIAGEDSKIIFYVGPLDRCFDFDTQSNELVPNDELNHLLKYHDFPSKNNWYGRFLHFTKDKSGNILIEISVPRVNEQIFQNPFYLLDPSGNLYRYSTGIGEASAAKRLGHNFNNTKPIAFSFISSQNLKKQAIISTDIGLAFIEFSEKLAINPFYTGWGTRAIIEKSLNEVIVLSNNARIGSIDLSLNKFSKIEQNLGEYFCGEYISVPGLSQISYQSKEKIWFSGEDQLIEIQTDQNICNKHPFGKQFYKFAFLNEREIAFIVEREHDLYIYNLDKAESRPFIKNDTTFNIGKRANEVYVSKDGKLWIASLNGLWQIDPKSGAIFHLNKDNGLADNRVICLHEAQDGKFWIGMIGGGLQIYDPETGILGSVNKSKGLSNNTVVGILEDESGDKWVSTFSGINVLSNEGEVLFKLLEKDGLTHKEANRFSYHKLKNGQLVFGTVSGVNVLDPQKIKEVITQKEDFQLYLTELSFFSKKQKKDTLLTSGFDAQTRIKLPATHRYLRLNFAISDYIHTQNNSFAYQLVRENSTQEIPEEDSWINMGNNSYLNLNDLPVGKHKLLIRGIDYKGQPINHMISVPIQVKEFFYKTWLFYLLCTLPFLVGIFLWNRRLVFEKKRLESEVEKRTFKIKQQAIKLKELDELKSHFFTNLSHEFRTPLTVISGMADQLEGQDKAKTLIKRNSANLLNMINQILDLRKLEVKKLTLDLIQGDIIAYLRYITESFSSLANSKGVHLQFSSDQQEIVMDYDPEKILRVVSNLVSNAIKFTPQGGKINIHASQDMMDSNNAFSLKVKDTGIGISEKKLPYIFDRFYQAGKGANQKKSASEGGTGIGLALTQELIKLMNGTITVKSNPNGLPEYRGTQFTINLPITRKAPLSNDFELNNIPVANMQAPFVIASDDRKEKAVSKQNKQLPSLLIVEDNQDIVHYLINCLKDQFQLDFAIDGEEGIEKALEQTPDIILSDVMMPHKDGFELCQTLKLDQRTSHIPIVLLTAKADVESRIEGIKRGADAYLAKPFNKKELLVSLQSLIEIRRRLQERYSSQEALPPSNDPALQMEDAFIIKIREIVQQHLDDENFGAPELAKELGMGKTNFYAKINALTNRSPALYIRSLRLHHSKTLLKNKDLNISQVAFEVGFKDPGYFTRCFTEEYGTSPKKYRK